MQRENHADTIGKIIGPCGLIIFLQERKNLSWQPQRRLERKRSFIPWNPFTARIQNFSFWVLFPR